MNRANEPRTVASGAIGRAPRAFNLVLGVWLLISAFAWPHPRWQLLNTAIPGMAIVVFALVACLAPRVRYLNTVLSAYLLVSAWCSPTNTLAEIATQANNMFVGLWIFLVSVLHDDLAGTGSCAPGRGNSARSV
jgi:hypothetical protein